MPTSLHRGGSIHPLLSLFLFGCVADVSPTNPFDPETPIEQPQKEMVTFYAFGTNKGANDPPMSLSDANILVMDETTQPGNTRMADENEETNAECAR